jgi:hypothetical protein
MIAIFISSLMITSTGCGSRVDTSKNSPVSETQAAKKEGQTAKGVDGVRSSVNDYLLYTVYLFSYRESICSPEAVEILTKQMTPIVARYGLPNAPQTKELIVFPNPDKMHLEMKQHLLVPHIGDEWLELVSFAGVTNRGRLPPIELRNLEVQLVRNADQYAITVKDVAQARLNGVILEAQNGQWVTRDRQK